MGLEKWSKDLEFGNFVGIVSPSCFEIIVWTHARRLYSFLTRIFLLSVDLEMEYIVTPRSHGYGNVTAAYIRRSEILSHIYAKHQYRQQSEYESTRCIIHTNKWVQLQSYHRMWLNITRILHHW